MPERVDVKVSKSDLSTIDDDGFYGDLPNDNEVDEENPAPGNEYVRECAEINKLLDKYQVAANQRLRATVRVYDCKEYSQEFLRSLLTG